MKRMLMLLTLLSFFVVQPALSQQPTNKEMQAQMLEAINELNNQITDLEKQIAEAKKNKEDPESIKELEQQLAMLKKQASLMGGLNKNLSKLPGTTAPKANPFATSDGKRFPARKTALLESLPKRTISKQELTSFLSTVNAELMKKLPAEKVSNVQGIIKRLEGDAVKIGLTGAVAWYNNAPAESILLLTYAGSKNPDDNTLNNCGAVFNLCGLEDKAIPVLKFVLAHQPGNSTVLNNLGQAFAGLGALDSAMGYLRGAMVNSPSHPEACATGAYIEAERGNTAEAVKLMTEALKTGYSDARVKFIENLDPGRSQPWYGLHGIDLKNDYYMTGDFDLPPNCRNWNNCEDTYEKQQAFAKKIDEMEVHYTNLVKQNSIVPITGDVSPWNEAIYFKLKQIGDDYAYRKQMDFELLTKQVQDLTENSNRERAALDARFEPQFKACEGVGGDCLEKVNYRYCRELVALEDRYHNALADIAEAYQHNWYPQDLEYHNKTIWLISLRSTNDQFLKAESATQTLHLLHQLKIYALSQCNPAGKPNCEKYNPANPANQLTAEYIDAHCPINIIVPAGALKMNLNCRQFKIEGGEGIIITYEKDFITKETTIAVGPGASVSTPIVPIAEAGVKAQVYVKFDGNNQPVDLGVSGEAEVEVVGPISPVIKSGFTVGINSGVNPQGQLKPFVGMSPTAWK